MAEWQLRAGGSEGKIATFPTSWSGPGWCARWRAVEDAEVRWLALCLAEAAGATRAQLEDLAARRCAARLACGVPLRRDPAALIAAVEAAGLWPEATDPPAGGARSS